MRVSKGLPKWDSNPRIQASDRRPSYPREFCRDTAALLSAIGVPTSVGREGGDERAPVSHIVEEALSITISGKLSLNNIGSIVSFGDLISSRSNLLVMSQ